MLKIITALMISTYHLAAQELAGNVCQLRAPQMVTIYTPVNKLNRVIGKPFEEVQADRFYCSASVITKNHILTAAHCFAGSIQQNIKFVQEHVPVLVDEIVDGKKVKRRPRSCLDQWWKNDPKCVRAVLRFKREIRFVGDIQVMCPGVGGKSETRNLSIPNGWPNPLFSAKRPYYDMAIWRVDKPFQEIEPVQYIADIDQLANIIRNQGRDCRALGYGVNSSGGAGVLKNMSINVSYLAERYLSSRGFDFVKPGDSGGALFCPNQMGELVQVGVVSNSFPFENKAYGISGEENMFTSLYFNHDWLQLIIEKITKPRRKELGAHDWHTVASVYMFKKVKDDLSRAIGCYNKKRRGLPRFERRKITQKFNSIKKELKKLKQDQAKKLEQNVFVHSKLKETHLKLWEFYEACQRLPNA